MADRVFVQNLVVFGTHGLFKGERELGQRFEIDLSCTADLKPAARSDDYHQTVCYKSLCEIAHAIVGGEPVTLVETIAERLAAAILERWAMVTSVTVAVRKPFAPLGVVVDHVGVEITRSR